MEKRTKFIYLIDIYSGLLTDKQQEILNLYYNEDITLTEIAQNQNTSRQAVFDLIKRSEALLLKYDRKLNLLDKYLKNLKSIDNILSNSLLDGHSDLKDELLKIKENL